MMCDVKKFIARKRYDNGVQKTGFYKNAYGAYNNNLCVKSEKEKGVATVYSIGVIVFFVGLVASSLWGLSYMKVSFDAQKAADFSSLAGAQVYEMAVNEEQACMQAEKIVHFNGAHLKGCHVERENVQIHVSIDNFGYEVKASALAGP